MEDVDRTILFVKSPKDLTINLPQSPESPLPPALSPSQFTYSAIRSPDGFVRSPASSPAGSLGDSRAMQRSSGMDRDIAAVEPSQTERPKDYRGRNRMWPGIVCFVLLVGIAATLMTYFGRQSYHASQIRASAYERNVFEAAKISGDNESSKTDIVSDDGAVGNPKKYPPSCKF